MNSDNDKEQGARSEEHGAAEKTAKSEGHRVRRQKGLSDQVFNRCECDSPQLAAWTQSRTKGRHSRMFLAGIQAKS
jgi:hypothetical protein